MYTVLVCGSWSNIQLANFGNGLLTTSGFKIFKKDCLITVRSGIRKGRDDIWGQVHKAFLLSFGSVFFLFVCLLLCEA